MDQSIRIYGSNGEFFVDEYGWPIDKDSMPDDYQQFHRFNVREYKQWMDRIGIQWDKDSELTIDILDIGAWHGSFNSYEMPDEDHRNEWAIECLNEAKEKQKSINDSKLKDAAIRSIIESFHNGQGKQMTELIDSYGLYDIWHDLLNYLKRAFGVVVDSELNYTFQQIVIQYHRIKYR
jgi:hypothetical protein